MWPPSPPERFSLPAASRCDVTSLVTLTSLGLVPGRLLAAATRNDYEGGQADVAWLCPLSLTSRLPSATRKITEVIAATWLRARIGKGSPSPGSKNGESSSDRRAHWERRKSTTSAPKPDKTWRWWVGGSALNGGGWHWSAVLREEGTRDSTKGRTCSMILRSTSWLQRPSSSGSRARCTTRRWMWLWCSTRQWVTSSGFSLRQCTSMFSISFTNVGVCWSCVENSATWMFSHACSRWWTRGISCTIASRPWWTKHLQITAPKYPQYYHKHMCKDVTRCLLNSR